MDAPLPEQHSLVMYQSSARQREHTVSWMAEALTRGDKVLHRAVDVDAPLDELGAAGAAARESGQLEILDARMCHEQTDGRHWALRELHEELLDRAHADGYAGVLLTADEHALRVLAPEPAERLAFEHDLERLTTRFGVRALCCYDLRVEQTDLLQAVAGVHFRSVADVQWSARLSDGRLLVRGAIDADNAGRFGAALRVAATHDVRTVDLAEVTVVSAAGIRAFDDAVDLLRRRARRLRLVNLSPAVNRALTLLRGAGDDQVELVPEHTEPAGDTRLAAAVREFAALTGVLLAGPAVATVLDRITRAAVDLVPAADLASITLRGSDGAFHTPTATDDVAIELDQLQYALDEGPCVDAARVAGHAVAVSEDLAAETAWPQFGRAAAGHGVRSVLSTALRPDPWPERTTGALNLYSRAAGTMTDADRDVALILAGHAWLALANIETDSGTTAEPATLPELQNARLRESVDSREMVGLVTGTLMHRRGISADEAFDLLHELSQRLNARLTDLDDLDDRCDQVDS